MKTLYTGGGCEIASPEFNVVRVWHLYRVPPMDQWYSVSHDGQASAGGFGVRVSPRNEIVEDTILTLPGTASMVVALENDRVFLIDAKFDGVYLDCIGLVEVAGTLGIGTRYIGEISAQLPRSRTAFIAAYGSGVLGKTEPTLFNSKGERVLWLVPFVEG
jgi:hypothetical protein